MFKLSISNIAWESKDDKEIYSLMNDLNFIGLEVAPTRIIPENPYAHIDNARIWLEEIQSGYGFVIPSMQSIWFGRTEKIFGSATERKALVLYTQKAIEFGEVLKCESLMFGCPRNRTIHDDSDVGISINFFKTIGEYAYRHNTAIAIEPNPPIYNTNFLNTTKDAISFVEEVNSKGFLLNLDTGTMIENGETVDTLRNKDNLINHVHISEPGLVKIKERGIHYELRDYLLSIGYDRFVSIEMKKGLSVREIGECMKYIRGVFI